MKKEAERVFGDMYARLAWGKGGAKKGGIGMSKLRWPARILALLVALGVAFFGLMFVASESGEVVTLASVDDAGASHETRLWITDLPDGSYLRGGADAQWVARVLARPDVLLHRDGQQLRVRLLVAEDKLAEVHAGMALKYGWADSLVGGGAESDQDVALHVVPR